MFMNKREMMTVIFDKKKFRFWPIGLQKIKERENGKETGKGRKDG